MIRYSIEFCEEYWNENAACWIPEGWVAIVSDNGTQSGRRGSTHVSGDTEDECRRIVQAEWPSAVEEEEEPTPDANIFHMRRLGVI